MRLIDADTLSREIQNYFKEQIEQHKYEVDVVDCNAELQKILNDHPTAYDVEAVVEKLDKASYKADCLGATVKYLNFDDTVHIVCAGGKE